MTEGRRVEKIIVTGANGVGKSHFAARLGQVRPDAPVVSYDALKLTTDWQEKPVEDIEAALASELDQPSWILEGGPSLLPKAIEKADALILLDPPEYVRAWQLACRPWKHRGRTRPELPKGNVDWPLQQYVFALRSLRKGARLRSAILEFYRTADHVQKWRCRNTRERQAVIDHLTMGGPDSQP